MERLVARQLVHYLDINHLLPAIQSGFRRGHSTETATVRVLSDLLDALDRGDTAALVLLDLSSAFDTVDHQILLEKLRVSFGIESSALSWFRSYLSGRIHGTSVVAANAPFLSTSSVVCRKDRS